MTKAFNIFFLCVSLISLTNCSRILESVDLDLASKGLTGISKEQFWYELENMIVQLTSK